MATPLVELLTDSVKDQIAAEKKKAELQIRDGIVQGVIVAIVVSYILAKG